MNVSNCFCSSSLEKCRLGDKLPGFSRLKQIHPLNLNHLLNVAVAVSLGHLLCRNRHGQCLLIQRQMYNWEIARLLNFKSAPFPDRRSWFWFPEIM